MHIDTNITGETHFIGKRARQKDPHFIIAGCGINRLDMRPDDFMKDTPTRRQRK